MKHFKKPNGLATVFEIKFRLYFENCEITLIEFLVMILKEEKYTTRRINSIPVDTMNTKGIP